MAVAEARLESIKTGLISAATVGLVAGAVLFSSVLVADFTAWPLPLPSSLLEWLVNIAVAITSGFFFGVTYRYIVRQDDNLHLGSGAVGAFAFVRSLAHIEANWDDTFALLTWVLITGESFLWFVSARYVLDWTISQGRIKPID